MNGLTRLDRCYKGADVSNGIRGPIGRKCLEDPDQVVGEGDITLESRQVMRNLVAVLEEAGFSTSDVVSATVYLTDIDTLDTFDLVWQEYFPDPSAYPSRAVVEVSALVLGIQLEISAIAVKDA